VAKRQAQICQYIPWNCGSRMSSPNFNVKMRWRLASSLFNSTIFGPSSSKIWGEIPPTCLGVLHPSRCFRQNRKTRKLLCD
jgi:hypothetical protein